MLMIFHLSIISYYCKANVIRMYVQYIHHSFKSHVRIMLKMSSSPFSNRLSVCLPPRILPVKNYQHVSKKVSYPNCSFKKKFPATKSHFCNLKSGFSFFFWTLDLCNTMIFIPFLPFSRLMEVLCYLIDH